MSKKFLIVDDHSIVRTGVSITLGGLFLNCSIDQANDGDSALEKIRTEDYDLVTLDIHMPQTDTSTLISNMLAIKPDLRILIFSMASELVFAKRYIKMGARGFLSKDATDEEIKRAITQILQNKKYISPELSLQLSDDRLNNRLENPFDNLSNRELQLAIQLVQGKSVSEIAELFNIGVSTASTHKSNIFDKLHISNVIELRELASLYDII